MTISISTSAFYELHQERVELSQHPDPDDALDVMYKSPPLLGRGYYREIELPQGFVLQIANYQLHDDLVMEESAGECSIECIFFLSGRSQLTSPFVDAEHQASPGRYAFCGSGFTPEYTIAEPRLEPMLWVDVSVDSELLRSSIGNPSGELPSKLQWLIRGPEQAYYHRFGTTSPTMQGALQQISHCPYQGATKRIYLQSKAWELLVLLIESPTEAQQEPHLWIKLEDIERIHYAKEILQQQLDNPPSLMELARRVGVNQCKLNRGFRQVFGTTAFSYLHNHRLEQARQLLEAGDMNVAEVARAVGFANQRYFAAAFRKKFGLNPKKYLMQQKYFI